jgi:glyoxylase-like metal-dependent hydrolase (beta-lactamase superfamily II)
MTRKTRDLIREADGAREDGVDEVRREMLDEASIVPPGGVTEIDLGERTVELHPRRGHTPSDVTVEPAEPSIVFFGDLRGVSAGDAAKGFRLPEAVSDWVLFNDRYFEVAMTAWYRELG